jgi:HAD superfamily hydrolase (TIGR01509 family)
MIRAVVLDIGQVLEFNDDTLFPAPFERRHGLAPGAVIESIARMEIDPRIGEATERQTRDHWQRDLGLDDDGADELMTDMWRWYVGELDQEMFDWFAGQRPARLTGIVSNSNPGAREAERCWGFEAVTDDIVYSHEVGLRKPDPMIYALAGDRLGVRPHEIVFLDDIEANVVAAREAGWHAVLHRSTPASIRDLERIIEEQSPG